MFQQPEPAPEKTPLTADTVASIVRTALLLALAAALLAALDLAATAAFVPLLRVVDANSGLGWFLRWVFAVTGWLIALVAVFVAFSRVPTEWVNKAVVAVALICAVLVFGVLDVDPAFTFAFALRPLNLGRASFAAICQAAASQALVDVGLAALLVAAAQQKRRAREDEAQAQLAEKDPSRMFGSVWRD